MSKIDINTKLMEHIFILMRQLKGEMAFEKNSNQLTLNQVQVIIFIEQQKRVKMTEIAEYFKITMPSATSLINTLSRKGYIIRTNDKKDRRTVYVSLSARTLAYVKKITDQRTQKITSLLSTLTDVEKKQLLKIVSKMSNTIDAEK